MKSLRLTWIEPTLVRLMDFAKCSCVAKTSVALLLMAAAGAPSAFAQEKTWGDSSTPLVYNVENTGANYPAPNFPSFAQLPIIRPLPDAFRFAEGYRDTSFQSWERRRNEIMAAVEKYELGPVPDCHDCTITSSYTPPASGSSTGSLTVNVTRNGKTLTLTSGVYIPQGMGSGPFPALIPMELGSFSFGGVTYSFPPPAQPDYGSLPASVFSGLPIATIGYVHTQVAGYAFTSPSVHTGDPFYLLYPELCAGTCSGTSNSGEYAAWAWGVSRLVDGIEIATKQSVNPMPIDVRHLAVTGCSYAGKMAMIAAAFDERIALSIAQENGGGGAPAWRVSHEIEAQGSVEDVDDTNYDWWAGQMYQFAGDNVYKLPTDHEELMAMVAPRALLQTGNTDYYWLSNKSDYIASRATQEIYNTFGIGDRFGFYIDGGHAHCATLPAEAPAVASFVNKFMLGQLGTNSDVEVYPTTSPNNYSLIDYKRWTWWWGGDPNNDPNFPNNWNLGGNVVMSLNSVPGLLGNLGLPPLPGFPGSVYIRSGDTVNAGYQLAMPESHPAATVSLTGGYVETDVKCGDGSSYTMTIPLPSQSTSIPANDRLWIPSWGTWQGSAKAPGCSSGVSLGYMEGAYFSALGVANGVGNPPAAPGMASTDTTDPLDTRFGCNANGQTTPPSEPDKINFNQ
jgi:hypothetical protein